MRKRMIVAMICFALAICIGCAIAVSAISAPPTVWDKVQRYTMEKGGAEPGGFAFYSKDAEYRYAFCVMNDGTGTVAVFVHNPSRGAQVMVAMRGADGKCLAVLFKDGVPVGREEITRAEADQFAAEVYEKAVKGVPITGREYLSQKVDIQI